MTDIHELSGTPPPEKPHGATHLFNAKPETDPGNEPMVTFGAAAANPSSNPDPTNKISLTRNKYDGPPVGGWKGVTIHMEIGYHQPSVDWLRNPRSQASAHWCVRRDGFAEQLVYENDRSWHAGAAGNNFFGIEHEGGCGTSERGDLPKLWITERESARLSSNDRMLQASTDLVAYLVVKYGLKAVHVSGYRVRTGPDTIAGHDQMAGNDHWDPGPYFPWKPYMATLAEKIAHRKGAAPKPEPKPKTGFHPDAERIPRWEVAGMAVADLRREKPFVMTYDDTDIAFVLPKKP